MDVGGSAKNGEIIIQGNVRENNGNSKKEGYNYKRLVDNMKETTKKR